eukprot:CAMPEP_0118891152 /NCGR_PEP_ID=MMETSP1166-20130328/1291_1 /TAXON_ID=1104430 /ORGANISM="Chrysoreinhardia sp, Strain CCMP3193" /LENGTH=446 /DNA_ID=CAMNT_0006829795 /DNA_START=313 /DNA_END=1653 /DNA_ORIENTATION=-
MSEDWLKEAPIARRELRAYVRQHQLKDKGQWIDDSFDYVRSLATYQFQGDDWRGVERTFVARNAHLPESFVVDIRASSAPNGSRALCAFLRRAADAIERTAQVRSFVLSTFFSDTKANVFGQVPRGIFTTMDVDCAKGRRVENERSLRRAIVSLAHHSKLRAWFTTAPDEKAHFAWPLKKVHTLPTGLPRSWLTANSWPQGAESSHAVVAVGDSKAESWVRFWPYEVVRRYERSDAASTKSALASALFAALGQETDKYAVAALALGSIPTLSSTSATARLLRGVPFVAVDSDALPATHLLQSFETIHRGNFTWERLTKKFWRHRVLTIITAQAPQEFSTSRQSSIERSLLPSDTLPQTHMTANLGFQTPPASEMLPYSVKDSKRKYTKGDRVDHASAKAMATHSFGKTIKPKIGDNMTHQGASPATGRRPYLARESSAISSLFGPT